MSLKKAVKKLLNKIAYHWLTSAIFIVLFTYYTIIQFLEWKTLGFPLIAADKITGSSLNEYLKNSTLILLIFNKYVTSIIFCLIMTTLFLTQLRLRIKK